MDLENAFQRSALVDRRQFASQSDSFSCHQKSSGHFHLEAKLLQRNSLHPPQLSSMESAPLLPGKHKLEGLLVRGLSHGLRVTASETETFCF